MNTNIHKFLVCCFNMLFMRKFITTKCVLWLLVLVFLFKFSMEDNSVSPMNKSEQEALHAVIRDFVGREWNGEELYPDPCGWTPIQGVSCDYYDGKWYITSLSFGASQDNSLKCSGDAVFSPHLFQLKYLKSFTLFKCFMHQTTTIPQQNWATFAETLETLEFRSNKGLTGELPAELSQLKSLRSLVLVENGLKGPLPSEFGNLVHLQQLELSNNNFSGRIPASILQNLRDLLILDLSSNSLSGPIPSSFHGSFSLLKLDLSNNLIDGVLPTKLGNLENLTLLDLRNNKISGGLVRSLQNMASIQFLLLSNSPIGGTMTGLKWTNLSNLTTLDLSNTNLTGIIPESLSGLKNLRYLALSSNNFVGKIPPSLAELPGLYGLYLNSNNLSGLLDFSGEFYGRMGRRFGAWDNPNLCYSSAGLVANGHVPVGVQQCKPEQEVVSANSDSNKVGAHQSPNSLASFGVSLHWVLWVICFLSCFGCLG